MSFSYEIPNYVSRAGIYRIFELPGRDISFSELALENRRFPVSYTTSNGIKRTVTLHVPETLEFVEIPANISLKDPDIEYWETFERLDANTLQMTSLFERSAQRIRPGEYHRYRNTALQIQDRTNKPLYLRIREPGLTPGTD